MYLIPPGAEDVLTEIRFHSTDQDCFRIEPVRTLVQKTPASQKAPIGYQAFYDDFGDYASMPCYFNQDRAKAIG